MTENRFNSQQNRNYSSSVDHYDSLVKYPSVIQFIKNWICVNFLIRPYMDKQFDLGEFVEASKQALEVRYWH